MLLFALQFTQQGRHIIFFFAPFPNSKAAALLCSWQLFHLRLFSTVPMESSAKGHWAMLSSKYLQQQACSQMLCCPKPLHFMRDLIILSGFLLNSPIELLCVFSLPWKKYITPTFGDKGAAVDNSMSGGLRGLAHCAIPPSLKDMKEPNPGYFLQEHPPVSTSVISQVNLKFLSVLHTLRS